MAKPYKIFRRPSIDLDAAPKTWEHRSFEDLKVGAIVADYGEITEIIVSEVPERRGVVHFMSGNHVYVDPGDELYSFQ